MKPGTTFEAKRNGYGGRWVLYSEQENLYSIDVNADVYLAFTIGYVSDDLMSEHIIAPTWWWIQ